MYKLQKGQTKYLNYNLAQYLNHKQTGFAVSFTVIIRARLRSTICSSARKTEAGHLNNGNQ